MKMTMKMTMTMTMKMLTADYSPESVLTLLLWVCLMPPRSSNTISMSDEASETVEGAADPVVVGTDEGAKHTPVKGSMDKAGANDEERFCDPNDKGTDLLLSVSIGLELEEATSESGEVRSSFSSLILETALTWDLF